MHRVQFGLVIDREDQAVKRCLANIIHFRDDHHKIPQRVR
jgi:hypothetical protein